MSSPEVKVVKNDGKKEVYKLIPKMAVAKRRLINQRGSKPAISYKGTQAAIKGDLSSEWPAIYDQGQIGSCTANAFCSCFKYLHDDRTFEPSRLYVYYKERYLENPNGPITDSGAWVSDGYTWVSKHGVCAENYWPYDISKVNEAPPAECDVVAKKHKVHNYYQVNMNNVHNTIVWCISYKKPVMMAFGVYGSFLDIKSDGMCPVPNPKTDTLYGGHEVVIVGYDDEKQLYKVANSWGKNWGDKGFFYMPYAFVKNPELVYDFSTFWQDVCDA